MTVFIIGWLLFLSAAWYNSAIETLTDKWWHIAWIMSGLLGIASGAIWMIYNW